jgi:hypothetical protein
VCLGVSHLWSFSAIFVPIRNFVARIPYVRRPLICPECSSFWMGIGVSIFYMPFSHFNLINMILCGVISYGVWIFIGDLIIKIKDKQETNNTNY